VLLLGLSACKSDCSSWPPAVRVDVAVHDAVLCSQIDSLRVRAGTPSTVFLDRVLKVGEALADGSTSFVIRLDDRRFVRGDPLAIEVVAQASNGDPLASARSTEANTGDGCGTRSFSLGRSDGGVADARPDIASDQKPTPDLSCEVVQAVLQADSCLLAGNPTFPGGGTDICTVFIDVGKGALGALAKFAVQPAKRPSRYRLELFYARLAGACGVSNQCGSCDSLSIPGEVRAYLVDGDWSEATATWSFRDVKANIPWTVMQDNAADATEVARFNHQADTASLVLERADAAAMDAFVSASTGGTVSLLVKPAPGSAVKYVSAQRDPNKCGTFGPPSLQITYCH